MKRLLVWRPWYGVFCGKFILVVLAHFTASDYRYSHVCDGVDAQKLYSTDSCDYCGIFLVLIGSYVGIASGLHRNYDEPSAVSASIGYW